MSEENKPATPPSPPPSGGGGAEQRQFPRIEVSTPVSFNVIIPSYNTGTSRDISEGGMCLETKSKLDKGTIIRLEFELPGDPPEHVEALGRVMWQRHPEGAELFLTGIKFLV